jgi:hypothetical protein
MLLDHAGRDEMGDEEAFPQTEGPRRAPLYAVICYLVLYGLAHVAIGVLTGFHISLNDWWGNLFIAHHLDLHHLASFYNGFYPVGYNLVLRAFASHPIELAYLFNIALGLALLASVAWLARRTLGGWWAFLVVVFASLQPLVFAYVATPSGDIGCAALSTLGIALLVLAGLESRQTVSRLFVLLGAASFGLGALLRYHGLALSVIFLCCMCLLWIRRPRWLAWGLVVFLAVYSIQIVATVAAGRAPFSTAYALNFWLLTDGPVGQANTLWFWYHISDVHVPSSMVAVVLGNPVGFVKHYSTFVLSQFLYVLPVLAWTATARRPQEQRLSRAVALASILFVLVVSTGKSDRGVLPIVPIQMWCLAAALKNICQAAFPEHWHRQWIRSGAVAVALAVVILTWAAADRAWVNTARTAKAEFAAVQALIVPRPTYASQVFTTNYDLYFPDIPGMEPHSNGGWPMYDASTYDSSENPDIPTDSLTAFYQGLKARGVRYLVLDAFAAQQLPDLGRMYTGALTSKDFTKIGESNGMVVFAVR